ncbi:hypothetical protein FisN_31Lh054 [Fistulifera solaris]|uniref:Uncharacterized protein n=1 Tax=Fistulifera solaris TaxID=1519565 RepID=A0A1Z5K694_FISSO|nr:hypothetical protein FisN_31Lh054 [Fistulifera solaris]|eukprot:GAX21767.1 hypothetical protein FisN_31Lh054 [Fistulifera solaris]
MSFLGHYDAMLDSSIASNDDDDDVRHILPSDEASDSSSSLGRTIVSSAPSSYEEEEIVFEWPSSQSSSTQQSEHIPIMSLSTHESMSWTNSEEWILAANNYHLQDMCVIVPGDEITNHDSDDSALSFQPSSVPSSDISCEDHHLWTSFSTSNSSSSSSSIPHDDDDDDDDWEHIHRVGQDEQGVYLQSSNNTLVTAPWSSWYQSLSSEKEWDELKSRVQEILKAFQADEFESYTAEELLALWIEQEENLFWNSKQQPENNNEGLWVRWGEAVAVAAAVASFGVIMLRRS